MSVDLQINVKFTQKKRNIYSEIFFIVRRQFILNYTTNISLLCFVPTFISEQWNRLNSIVDATHRGKKGNTFKSFNDSFHAKNDKIYKILKRIYTHFDRYRWIRRDRFTRLSEFSVCLVLKRRLISNEADSAEFCLLKWLFKYGKRFRVFLNFSHILFTDFSRFEKFVIADKISSS